MFLVTNCQNVFKNNGEEKNKHSKIALLDRSKLNGIEKIISKALAGSDISYEEFTLMKIILD